MPFPVRTRGLVGALAVLAVAPIVLFVGIDGSATTHATANRTSATSIDAERAVAAPTATPATAERASRAEMLRLVENAREDSIPTPAVAPVAATASTRPAPTPRPTAAPTEVAAVASATAPAAPAGSIQQIIIDAANRHGVSSTWMLKIARCESTLNPRAYNPTGPYIGLFQFLPSTFRAHGGTDIYDPVQQAEITATMLAAGQAHQWGCA